MVALNLSHNNYQTLLQNLARQLKVKPENNSIIIPPDIGEGIIKVIFLPNGLQTLMIKINFYKDVLVKSGNTSQGDYVLNFDESEMPNENNADSDRKSVV